MSHLLCQANALRIPLADGSVQCCVTSPPYWGLRSYLPDGHLLKRYEIGSERTPDEYVAKLVSVFREVRRVLRSDGVFFLNIGDSYQNGKGHSGGIDPKQPARRHGIRPNDVSVDGLKRKDLVGVPWRLAFALQADGWWLRDKITWAKAEVDDDDKLEGSAMPGSQRDRCTAASEEIFMFSKSERYYFDPEGCKTKSGATLRNVWRMNSEPTKQAHFATFPRELPRRAISLATSAKGCCPDCGAPWVRRVASRRVATRPGNVSKVYTEADMVLHPESPYQKHNGDICGNRDPGRHCTVKTTEGWDAGCSCGGDPVPCVVLDPFSGIATTGVAAAALGRHYIGLDLNDEYVGYATQRINHPHAPVRRESAGVTRVASGQMDMFG